MRTHHSYWTVIAHGAVQLESVVLLYAVLFHPNPHRSAIGSNVKSKYKIKRNAGVASGLS